MQIQVVAIRGTRSAVAEIFQRTLQLAEDSEVRRGVKIGVEQVSLEQKTVGIRDAHVMGNSAGGSIVLFAAMRAEWPIRKAISIGGSGGPYMRADTYGPLKDYVPDKEAMRRIVELMVSRRDAVMEELVEERYRKSLLRGHWENLSAPRLRPPGPGAREESDNKSFFDSLARTRVPVLLIAGSDDVLLEQGWERQLASHIAQARTLLVEGARHQPHFDAPDTVCDAIESFLAA